MDTQNALKQLEALVINNPDLDKLETLISEFNIFEAIGSVRQELRHSDFLAFLMNPSEKHGLGDKVLKRFLVRVLAVADDPPITPITINVQDFSKAIVERETQHVDLLMWDSDSQIVCIVENKIFSSEHSNQLERYLAYVKNRFVGYKIIPVFLTPDGITPASDDSPYIPISYSEIATLIETVRQNNQSVIGTDVSTLMKHYVTMLRRHIMTESDIAELCRQIYQAHKNAIDLIIEHMPDKRQALADYLIQLVNSYDSFREIRFSKSYIDFGLSDWLDVPEFNRGIGWANNDSTLSIEFSNSTKQLNLYIVLGPVKEGNQHIRERIFEHASRNKKIFKGCRPKLSSKWTMIYKLPLLKSSEYDDATVDELTEIIKPKWERFLENTLPAINSELLKINFG